MSVIAKLSILKRIMLLSILPFLGLIIVCAYELYTTWQRSNSADALVGVVKVTPAISNLVHELQKERGRSAGFLSSKGNKFSDTILTARQDSDAALQTFNSVDFDALGLTSYGHFKKPLNKATDALASLEDMRSRVDQHDLTVKKMASYYTPLITNLLKMIEGLEDATQDSEIIRLMIAYNGLLVAKEYAGLERAMGAAGFGKGEFSQGIYQNLVTFIGNQKAKFGDFKQHAKNEEISKFNQLQNDPSFVELERLRKIALAAPFGGGLSDVTAPHWFETTTKRINLIKEIENSMTADLVAMASDYAKSAQNQLYFYLAIIISLMLVTAILSYWVSSSIIKQLKKLTNIMRRLSRDDTSSKLVYLDRKDELGVMAKTIDVFRNNSLDRNKLRSETVAEREREAQKQGHITNVINRFSKVDREIRQALEEQTQSMKKSADSLHNSAKNVSERAGMMKSSSQDASQNVEVVAGSTRELSLSMEEISSQVNKAEQIVRETAETTEKTDKEVSTLSESADKIGDVVELVRDIAEQTNLLALNATIEAARAGEAGKGFAIVAQEVKQLSEETAKATDEIVSQISAVQNSSHSAVGAIKNIMRHVGDISKITVSITAAIEEQEVATRNIAESVNAASLETSKVVESVESVNVSIDEAFQEVDKVQSASSSLADVSVRLAEAVHAFLEEVGEDVENRRSHLRRQVNQVGIITQEGKRKNYMIENASKEGMYISGSGDLQVSSDIELELSDGRLLPAKIVRADDNGYGIKFHEPIEGIKWLKDGLAETEMKMAG